MDKEPRHVSVEPDSEVATLIKEAADSNAPLVVDTGEASYQVSVSPIIQPGNTTRVRHLAHRLAGSLANFDIPGWETSEAAERWVEHLRQADRYPLQPPPRS